MRDIVFSKVARDDILSIWRHIARENFEAAEQFQTEVEASAEYSCAVFRGSGICAWMPPIGDIEFGASENT